MATKRPLIAITLYGPTEKHTYWLPAKYIDAVRRAGGIPVLIPSGDRRLEELVARFDGFILAGGGDIHPSFYGGQQHPSLDGIEPERDEFELALAETLLQHERPVFGICRGMQVLNVATGGDLVEHIPDRYGTRVIHLDREQKYAAHEVKLDPHSRLAAISGTDVLQVASTHHQAVGRLGRGWRTVAVAPDNVVEAMEYPEHPWAIAVQWHPELTLDDAPHLRLFEAFIRSAMNQRNT